MTAVPGFTGISNALRGAPTLTQALCRNDGGELAPDKRSAAMIACAEGLFSQLSHARSGNQGSHLKSSTPGGV